MQGQALGVGREAVKWHVRSLVVRCPGVNSVFPGPCSENYCFGCVCVHMRVCPFASIVIKDFLWLKSMFFFLLMVFLSNPLRGLSAELLLKCLEPCA